MRIHRLLLAGATALTCTAPVAADQFKGWYVGLEGGGNWIDDSSAVLALPGVAFGPGFDSSPVTFDEGWGVFATVGYAFSGHWRLEGEVGFRSNEASARWVLLDSIVRMNADVDEYSLIANVLYDVPLGDRIVLSLGAGAGGDNVRIDDLPLLSLGTVSDDDWRFAAQGIAQVSYALSPRWQATLSYRYLHVWEPSFGPFNVLSLQETIEFDDLSKHSVSAGLRFDLFPETVPAAAPPPPPAPPPPSPPPAVKQFIVFFGFDQCTITGEADRVLGEAAATVKATGAARVTIVGHTDTSGSNAYNQRLSDCRAGAAKSNLVAKGVPDGAISTAGRGEAELMVQTGDGVKEPQNRRATVDLE